MPPATMEPAPATTGLLIWRELRVGVPLCIAIAAFLSLIFKEPFHQNLVYSLCIGLTIQALIEGGRFAFTRWQRRGAAPVDPAIGHWPGWAVMGPWIGVSIAAGYTFGSFVAGWLTGTGHLTAILRGDLRALALILPVVLLVSVGATYHFYARSRIAATEAQAQAARSAAAENQLRLLESQLEPHMLFNTLANLRVLIATDPARAQDMLDRLIAFLRATLNASRSGRHTLAVEFARIDDYLALMAVRMGPRLAVHRTLPPELADVAVPPLLLQPLVENCIKHGLEPKVEGGRIQIDARRDGDRLVLTVADSGIGLPTGGPLKETGFGLHQVRERLATLYGSAASLQITAAPDDGGGTVATIHLPLETPP